MLLESTDFKAPDGSETGKLKNTFLPWTFNILLVFRCFIWLLRSMCFCTDLVFFICTFVGDHLLLMDFGPYGKIFIMCAVTIVTLLTMLMDFMPGGKYL
jgi:hypothetical protein